MGEQQGSERLCDLNQPIIIDDSGAEVEVAPEDFWQYEHDAIQGAILIEEFEAMEGVTLYGDSDSNKE